TFCQQKLCKRVTKTVRTLRKKNRGRLCKKWLEHDAIPYCLFFSKSHEDNEQSTFIISQINGLSSVKCMVRKGSINKNRYLFSLRSSFFPVQRDIFSEFPCMLCRLSRI